MTDGNTKVSSREGPPARRGARVTSRVLAVVGVLAVGGFGYLLGVRLSSSNTAASSQGGFGGPGGFGGAAGTAQGQRAGGAGPGAASGGSFAQGGAGTAGRAASGTGALGRSGGAGRGSGRSTVVSVQTLKASTGVLQTQHQAAATVVPLTQSNVGAQAAGTVQQIVHSVGDTLRQGQPVVVLQSETLQAAVVNAQNSLQQARVSLATQTNANTDQRNQLQLQVALAQAALASAQQTYQANSNLFKIGGIAQSDLNTSRSAVETARASLASAQNALATNERAKNETLAGLQLSVQQAQNSLTQAQQNLANATVRAPFSGQISAIPVSVGENLSVGNTAFTLVSPERKVSFNVAPTDAASLRLGQQLTFTVGSQNYQVKLDQNPAAPVNSVVAVSARLLGSNQPSVGAVGTVSYTTPAASGTLVPSSALETDGTQSYVFVVQNAQAKRQNVTLLGQSGTQSAVGGLTAGSEIIGSPPAGLLDGTRVTVGSGTPGASSAASGGAADTGTSGSSTSGSSTHRRWRGAGSQSGSSAGQGAGTAPANSAAGGSQ